MSNPAPITAAEAQRLLDGLHPLDLAELAREVPDWDDLCARTGAARMFVAAPDLARAVVRLEGERDASGATLDGFLRAVLAAIGRDALPAERALSRADAAAYVASQVRLVVDDVTMARDAHFARAERAEDGVRLMREARDRAADAFDDLVARVWRAATGDEHEGPASVEALLDAVTRLREERHDACVRLATARALVAAYEHDEECPVSLDGAPCDCGLTGLVAAFDAPAAEDARTLGEARATAERLRSDVAFFRDQSQRSTGRALAMELELDAALAHADELTAALRAAQDEVARLREDVSLWQRSAEAHRAEVVEVRKSRDHWRECEERQRAATDDAEHVATDLRDDLDRLRAIVEGRTTPPTDAESAAHDAAGGAWLVAWRRGERPTVASIVSGPRVWWPTADVVTAVALDAQRRPCAWPTTEAPDAR